MWGWGLVALGEGGRGTRTVVMQLCNMSPSFPVGTGQYTSPSLTTQKTQHLRVRIRSLWS